MAARDRLMEEYEDALFAVLISKVMDEEGEELLRENEQLKSDPNFIIPEETDRRSFNTIRRAFNKQKWKATRHSIYLGFQRISVAAFVTMLLFSGVYAAFPPVRVATLNLLIQVSDVSTQMSFGIEDIPDSQSIRPLSDSYYQIGDLPDGFTLIDEGSNSQSFWEVYADEYDRTIYFSVTGGVNLIASVDTEDADSVEHIEIAGHEGLFIVKGDQTHIAFGDTEHKLFVDMICMGLSKEDTLNIAHNLNFND